MAPNPLPTKLIYKGVNMVTDNNQALKKLLKIAQNQQKIITKMAQLLPNVLEPAATVKKDASVILGALPQDAKSAIVALEVHPGIDPAIKEVRVKFDPSKKTSSIFNVIENTIKYLQSNNMLQSQHYKIKEVA